MTPIQENPGLNAELARIAQSHVDSAQQQYALTFDYSEASLNWVDDTIAKHHPDGTVPDEALIRFGAYVGETVRRSLGGIWVQDERGVALLQRVGGRELSASPFSWVQKRISNGMSDSVATSYGTLKGQIGQTGVRLATAAAAQPAATGASPEESGMLARAPLMVFMLVAAADGKVDKKEMEGFKTIIGAVMEGAGTPLLHKAITELLEQIDQFMEGIFDRDPIEELQRIATILDTHYPREAKAFKECLVSIGVQIASASGGFLGFGSKISKDEKIVLAGIAMALGLIEE